MGDEYLDYWASRMLGQQQPAQLSALQNMLGGQALGSYTTAGSLNGLPTSNYGYNPFPLAAPAPIIAKAETEADWLRRRVDEVCWKAA